MAEKKAKTIIVDLNDGTRKMVKGYFTKGINEMEAIGGSLRGL